MSTESDARQGNLLFPVFLKIDQLQLLVVGGASVGLEKLEALLKSNPDAQVHLLARSICPEIETLAAQHPSVKLSKRSFAPEDLQGVDVLILATQNRETNQQIRLEAKKRGILTNVADTPDLCDFYLGATVKKGNLKIGISTNGKSPTFAKRLRELLQDALPEDVDELLNNLQQFRNTLTGDFQDKVEKLNEHTASLVGKQADKKTS